MTKTALEERQAIVGWLRAIAAADLEKSKKSELPLRLRLLNEESAGTINYRALCIERGAHHRGDGNSDYKDWLRVLGG